MLLVKPPQKILGHKVNTNYLYWLGIGTVLQNNNLTVGEKAVVVVSKVFGARPKDESELVEKFCGCTDFYRCGKPVVDIEPPKEQLLCWRRDSQHLWADFLIYAKTDFNTVDYMHWWEFYSLFESLPPDSWIKTAISTRDTDISEYSGKGNEKSREKIIRSKKLVSLEPIDEYEMLDIAMERSTAHA